MQPGDPAARAEGLVVWRGDRTALSASDFEIPSGRLTALVGPNGSGKSTVLHALAGLLPPHRGSLTVLGCDADHVHDRVAYVLQSTSIGEVMPLTVAEVVLMARYGKAGMFGRLNNADRDAAQRAMERLGIAALAARNPALLSVGQRQRVFVAQGLAQEAEVLLLDEPVTALDVPSHEAIDAAIEEEVAAGRTVVLTTHDLDEARRAHHVLLLAGHVVASGPPDAVLTDDLLADAYGAYLLHAEGGIGFGLDDPYHGHGSHGPSRGAAHAEPPGRDQ